MHHEQDMRNMGGLAKKIPITYWLMIIGTLALTGVGIPGTPLGFAGFFSKDSIIETAYAAGTSNGYIAFWLLVVAALFTSFYSWRLIHLTFHGKPRWGEGHGHAHAHAAYGHDDHGHVEPHESPNVMLVPLYILAVGAVLAGTVFYDLFFGHAEHIEHFFQGSLVVSEEMIEAAHGVPLWVKWSATIAMLVGFAAAWQMYIRDPAMPKRLADANPGLYQFLLNKWYFDELYDFLFVRPANWLGNALWKGFDDFLIDKTITEGLGHRVKDITSRVVKLQSGYLYHYAFAMLIGVAALLTWAIAAGGLLG
jgi:NADH-quinone oxidoreductase subunit L